LKFAQHRGLKAPPPFKIVLGGSGGYIESWGERYPRAKLVEMKVAVKLSWRKY
jgi:hypothetical protein